MSKTVQEKDTLKNLSNASNVEMLAIANVRILTAHAWYADSVYVEQLGINAYNWQAIKYKKDETASYSVNIIDLPGYVGIINTFTNDDKRKSSYITILNKDQSDVHEYKTVNGVQVLSKTHYIYHYDAPLSEKNEKYCTHLVAVVTYNHLLQEPVNTTAATSKKEKCVVYRWFTVNPNYVPTKEQTESKKETKTAPKKAAKTTASVDKALITAESEKARVAAKKATK